ncbi:MFS transporter [Lactobacillus xujianguonis]|uniref:MFS transporter n=1 Tax=Lactobacillus xujianguonis TaxID=2495899 RepID=UPI000FD7A64E|nr:MFS transporter [Lactobacillus xujianguonis]RVU73988.1 MFS transporter [Lactobacillus xujianguonis]
MFNKIAKRVYQKREITLLTAVSFGCTDFMGGGAQAVISAWLLYFYVRYCNLSATQAALIVSCGQIVSAVSGVLIGGISDNFGQTKWGKKYGRRHFFIYLSAPLMFTFALMWLAEQNFWYYLLIYCSFCVISTVMIPYQTLPTEMTNQYDERTKLSTARMFFSSIAGSLATFIPGQLFKILGTRTALPFFINGLIFSTIFCLVLLITAWNTWELPVSSLTMPVSDKRKNILMLIKDYLSFFKVKSCRQHFGIYLASFTGRDMVNMVFTFFCLYCLHLTATDAANLMALSIVGIVVTLVGGYLFTRISPKRLYELAYMVILLAILAFYLIYQFKFKQVLLLMYLAMLVYQIASSLVGFVPWQVYAFLPDIDEIVSGENRAGSLASLINLLRNSTSALVTVLVGIFLDQNGFVKGANVQSLSAKNAILEVMLMGALLIILAWLIATRFNLNKTSHQLITREIERLKNGGQKEDVDPQTKAVVEDLTGIKYENTYRKQKNEE